MPNVLKRLKNFAAKKMNAGPEADAADAAEPAWQNNALYDPVQDPLTAAPTPAQAAPPAVDKHLAKAAARKAERGHGKFKLKDRHVGKKHKGAADVAKSAHEVQRVTYDRMIGSTDQNEGFFKKASKKTGSDMAAAAGIDDVAGDPRLVARSLASTRLNDALGQDTLATEVQAKHGGKKGVVSAKAKGQAMMKTTFGANGNITNQQGLDADLRNPESQRGLANLQFMDYLTGQVDRHEGNIFLDKDSGKVQGIDNDLAFGTDNAAVDGKRGNNFGAPQKVDRAMADSFANMTEDDFTAHISGQKGDYASLNAEEIDAAKERFRTMKGLLSEDGLDGKKAQVIDQWDDNTYEDSMNSIRNDKGEIKTGRWDRGNDYLSRSEQTKKMFGTYQ